MAPPSIDLEAIRRCVHCGICLPQCPTYRVLGEEMDSPRGRIYLMRALAEQRLEPTPTFARHIDLCLGCRACETACPAGVPFGTLLESTRAHLDNRASRSGTPWLRRLLYGLFPNVRFLAAVMAALRLYQRSGLQRLVRSGAWLRRWPRAALLEALLPRVPAPLALPALVPARGARRGCVGLLTGCVQRFLYPHVNEQTARLLSLAGWDVLVPPGQGCCGALELHAGRLEAFRARARALAASFDGELDAVVVNAAGCGSAMKEYAHWVPDDPAVAALAARVRDVSEVLLDADLPLGPLPLTVTYHDPCHLAHGQRIRSQPCCGSAGVYNLLEPAVAERLLDAKLDRILATGARVVASGNPGCLLQIAKGARGRGLDLEVVHPVELLARSAEVAGGAEATDEESGA
jgi:glycolate oxidase iron-sulfur subunit